MVPMSDYWAAPTVSAGSAAFDATVEIPGSKSITNRAFILAALASGPSTINGALRSRDSDLMIAGLRAMGVDIEAAPDAGPFSFRVTPVPAPGSLHAGEVDCGLAGTVMRFVPPVAAFAEGTVRFDGDEYARNRPMGVILDALRRLGVQVEGHSLPFDVHGAGGAKGGLVEIDASGSSQFVSGLLLAGARFEQGITVRHVGEFLPSMPHIEMTIAMLREAAVTVTTNGSNEWSVAPGEIAGREWNIEPDLSNATPFLAAAAVTGSTVRVPHWPSQTTQPGDAFREIAERMGATVTLEDGVLSVTGPVSDPSSNSSQPLRGIDLDMGDIGELTPTVAAMAALASTPSRLTGIAHLRGHETDRLAALTHEINNLGGNCKELPDGLEITPAPLHAGKWHSYADHRMATAGAIIGLKVPGVEVQDIHTTSKTLPDFPAMWDTMLRG